MSILIKGMDMPSCCDGCTFSDWSNLHQTVSCKLHDYDPCFADHSREYVDKRADFCPLVDVPEPHGDLIDRDALEKAGRYEVYFSKGKTEKVCYVTDKYLDEFTAVIPRESGENHDES